MLYRLFILAITALFFNSVHAQISTDSIEMTKKPLGGFAFYQHNKRLSIAQLTTVTKSNPEATKYVNKAKANNAFSMIAGAIGGFMVGYELGTAAGGGKFNTPVFAVGIGLIGIGIPLETGAKKNFKKAIHIFNAPYR